VRNSRPTHTPRHASTTQFDDGGIAVHDGHLHVHQDQIEGLRSRQITAMSRRKFRTEVKLPASHRTAVFQLVELQSRTHT
jgi:hypothetical protein